MLVLSRKTNERICIGDGIEVEVLAIQGGRVKLGISAPDHVRILRTEVLQLSPQKLSPPERTRWAEPSPTFVAHGAP